MLVQVQRSIVKTAPKYLQELFSKNSEHSRRKVTTRGQDNLHLPRPSTELLRKSFSFQGALKYNALPQELKKTKTVYQRSRTVYTNCSLTATSHYFCLCSYIVSRAYTPLIVYRTCIKTHTVDAAFPAQIKSSISIYIDLSLSMGRTESHDEAPFSYARSKWRFDCGDSWS